MPNRILKESICYSESICSLTWFEEVLFYRLIVNADDYGRLDGRMAMLQSKLFPLRRDITASTIQSALNTLTAAGMIQVYEYDQRSYLQLTAWEQHQQVRAKKSKFPAPPEIESVCNQMISNVPVIQSVSYSESEAVYDARARMGDPASAAADPLDPTPDNPIDAGVQQVLMALGEIGFTAINRYVEDEVLGMITLPDLGATPETRTSLLLDAIKAIAGSTPDKRSWGCVAGLARKWAREGRTSGKQSQPQGDSVYMRRFYADEGSEQA